MKILTNKQFDQIYGELLGIQKIVTETRPVLTNDIIAATQNIVKILLDAEEIKISIER